MFFVFCIEVLHKATICPAFFPATFNWTGEFSRRMITFLNVGHAKKRDEDRLDSRVTCGMRADSSLFQRPQTCYQLVKYQCHHQLFQLRIPTTRYESNPTKLVVNYPCLNATFLNPSRRILLIVWDHQQKKSFSR